MSGKEKKEKKKKLGQWEKTPKSDQVSTLMKDATTVDSRTPKQKMEHERYLATMEMIRDAARIYQKKLTIKHKTIYQLEEEIRKLSVCLNSKILLENLPSPTNNNNNNNSTSSSPTGLKRRKSIMKKSLISKEPSGNENATPPVEELFPPVSEFPCDINEIKTLEHAKDEYNHVLLYYLEHQAILDSIVAKKQERKENLRTKYEEMKLTIEPDPSSQSPSEESPRREKKEKEQNRIRSFTSNILKRKTLLSSSSDNIAALNNSNNSNNDSETALILLSNKEMVNAKKNAAGLNYDDFIKKRKIGNGAFGTVYLVEKKNTGQLLAMKVMKKQAIMSDPDSLRHVIMELEFMKQLSHHPFIVSLHSSFQTEADVSIIMEWVGGGSLFDFLASYNQPFSEEIAQFYAAQVLLALQTLHSNDVVYRDLKLENILLDEKGYIRLSDFGLSARAKRGEKIHSFSGTATYLAPEIIIDTGEDGHDQSVDIWCFGIMLFIMLTLEPPFWAEHYPDLFYAIRNTEVDYSTHPHLSDVAIDLLSKLLKKDPKKRIGCGPLGIAGVQSHPFFSGLDWKALLAKKIQSPFRPPIYKGKKIDPNDEDEEETEEPQNIPVDLFRGFSFVWNAGESEDLLSEQIAIFQQKKENTKTRKNKIVANFFLWVKEICGLNSPDGQFFSVKWKHEAKKYLTTIGPESKSVDQTEFVACKNNIIQLEGDLHHSCLPFDYVFSQDRKTMAFDSRPIVFSLLTRDPVTKKTLTTASFTVDMADYCFHKFEKTQIFSFDNSGSTAVISIICSWKSYNGDIVDNLEKHRMNHKF